MYHCLDILYPPYRRLWTPALDHQSFPFLILFWSSILQILWNPQIRTHLCLHPRNTMVQIVNLNLSIIRQSCPRAPPPWGCCQGTSWRRPAPWWTPSRPRPCRTSWRSPWRRPSPRPSAWPSTCPLRHTIWVENINRCQMRYLGPFVLSKSCSSNIFGRHCSKNVIVEVLLSYSCVHCSVRINIEQPVVWV